MKRHGVKRPRMAGRPGKATRTAHAASHGPAAVLAPGPLGLRLDVLGTADDWAAHDRQDAADLAQLERQSADDWAAVAELLEAAPEPGFCRSHKKGGRAAKRRPATAGR